MKRYILNILAIAVIATGAVSSAFGASTMVHRAVMNNCTGGGGTCTCAGACAADSTGCNCV
jgi:hypothetical protein